MTSVAILGAGGRMGMALIGSIQTFQNLHLVAAVEQPGNPNVGLDSGMVSGTQPNGILVSDDIDAAVAASDVVIDFTFHTAVPETARLIKKYGKAYVLGTTGLTTEELSAVEATAQTVPVLMAPNMSMGVNMLLSLVKQAASILNEGYDAEIVEMHHRHKKDAPSGTALALAKAVAAGRSVDLDQVVCYGREGMTGERNPETIAIHALRGGDVIGDHTVIFAADGERVELTHKATGRGCLSGGALRAAGWLVSKDPGFHSMREMLGI